MTPVLELVVPAYNEADRLPLTLTRLRSHLLAHPGLGPIEVVVVDNGSSDATAEVAAQLSSPALPVRVLRCGRRGKGAAVRHGMTRTTAELVGFMDADGATDLEALAEAIELVRSGVDVAVGSRAVDGAVTNERHSQLRVQGARLYRRCTRWSAPGIADTQCGFKLFRGDLARDLFPRVRCDGFAFDVEVIGLAMIQGALVEEFPVVWYDVPGSTFDPLRHGAASFWELLVMSRRLRSAARQTRPAAPLAPATPDTPTLVSVPLPLPAAADG